MDNENIAHLKSRIAEIFRSYSLIEQKFGEYDKTKVFPYRLSDDLIGITFDARNFRLFLEEFDEPVPAALAYRGLAILEKFLELFRARFQKESERVLVELPRIGYLRDEITRAYAAIIGARNAFAKLISGQV